MKLGPGFLPTFLYYFSTTAIAVTLITSRAMGIDLDTGIPQQVGLVSGLAVGLTGGYFNRSVSFSVAFEGKKKFLARLEQILNQMKYQQVAEEDGMLMYERSHFSKWFSGKIFVQLDESSATITSRSAMVQRLRKEIE